MKMLLVQHLDGTEWVDSYREDLGFQQTGILDDVPAVFYTRVEAEAYIVVMCGLIHMGGNPDNFRLVNVEYDGDGITYRDVVTR